MASSAGSATAGLFSGQPLTNKSSGQLKDAKSDLHIVQEMKRVSISSQCTVHQKACPARHRKEEFKGWRDAQFAKRQLDPSKAEVTVIIGWLQHEKKELHFSPMAVAALKDKKKGLMSRRPKSIHCAHSFAQGSCDLTFMTIMLLLW
eukprot:353872-Chlamydomonas_euryale.AAC.18